MPAVAAVSIRDRLGPAPDLESTDKANNADEVLSASANEPRPSLQPHPPGGVSVSGSEIAALAAQQPIETTQGAHVAAGGRQGIDRQCRVPDRKAGVDRPGGVAANSIQAGSRGRGGPRGDRPGRSKQAPSRGSWSTARIPKNRRWAVACVPAWQGCGRCSSAASARPAGFVASGGRTGLVRCRPAPGPRSWPRPPSGRCRARGSQASSKAIAGTSRQAVSPARAELPRMAASIVGSPPYCRRSPASPS